MNLDKSILLLVSASLIASVAIAQTKTKPKNKPTQKPTQQPTTKPTVGTVQMPGDKGILKTIYQLGEKGSELHFTLDSAAFDMRFGGPQDAQIAGEKQRLLILNITVQNPQKTEMSLDSGSFRYTVVAPDDTNFEFNANLLDANKRTRVSQYLKPAQKIKCLLAIPIHTIGPVNKLIVARGDKSPVLRYDLSGKVAAMKSVFSKEGVDVADKGGLVALKQPFDMGAFDISFDDVSVSTDDFDGYPPAEGSVFMIFTVSFTNRMSTPQGVAWNYFTPNLKDAGGTDVQWSSSLYSLLSFAGLSQEVEPGATIRGRYVFTVTKAATALPLTFSFMDNGSKRSVAIDLKK